MTYFLCFFNFNNFKLGQNWREFGSLKAVNKRSVESKKFFNAKKKWKRIIWAQMEYFWQLQELFQGYRLFFLVCFYSIYQKERFTCPQCKNCRIFPSLFTWNQSWQIISLKICLFYKFRSSAFWFLCVFIFTLLEAWNLPQ